MSFKVCCTKFILFVLDLIQQPLPYYHHAFFSRPYNRVREATEGLNKMISPFSYSLVQIHEILTFGGPALLIYLITTLRLRSPCSLQNVFHKNKLTNYCPCSLCLWINACVCYLNDDYQCGLTFPSIHPCCCISYICLSCTFACK